MMHLKACPRCHGDLVLVSYLGDDSMNCLQCGFTRTLPMAPQLRTRRPHAWPATAA